MYEFIAALKNNKKKKKKKKKTKKIMIKGLKKKFLSHL